MLRPNKKNNRGYIALISAIIMMVILTLVSVITSHSSFLGRFDTQVFESKDKSYSLAAGCLDHARLKLAQGEYTGDEDVTIGDSTCHIDSIDTNSGSKIITATATVSSMTTKLRLTVSETTLMVESLVEMGGL